MLLAALASGRSAIDGALLSDDTTRMSQALRTLGFHLEIDADAARITVDGQGGVIPSRGANLDAGGAGTAMRFLVPFLTLARGRFQIDGNERMRRRPIAPLVDALRRMGARVYSADDNGCPPVIIESVDGVFEGGETAIDASASSQFVSALLMPAPLWRKGLRLRIEGEAARPFIAMTVRMMREWGVEVGESADSIIVEGGRRYEARQFAVEPDASAASYFAAAAALCGGRVTIERLSRNSVQGDIGFLGILEQMGARISWNIDSVTVAGDGRLRGVDVAMNSMPDMVATLAALAPFASSPTRIRKVGFIRHHESDRIDALAAELRRIGASVREFDDGLSIEPAVLRPASIETYDDHRIAMSFAIAGLRLPGLRIKNPSCVAKTFPDFFERLRKLGAAS